MPMLPSSSSAVRQVPALGTRSKIEPSIAAAPRAARQADGDRRDVDAERQHAAARERGDVAAGPAADVEDRPDRALEHALVAPRRPGRASARAGSRSTRPASSRHSDGPPAVAARPRRGRPPSAITPPRKRRARTARRGTSPATARASSIVSTSRSGASSPIAAARPRAAARAARGPCSRRSSARRPGARGRGRAGRAPSSRRPAPGRGPRRRRGAGARRVEQRGRDLRRVHPDQERRPADVVERCGEPLVEAAAALGDHLEAVRQPRRPARRRARARGGRPASPRPPRACRPARPRPGARPARACTAGTAASSTRPGTGALAITISVTSSRASTAAPCRGPRAACRARVPVTFERPARGR